MRAASPEAAGAPPPLLAYRHVRVVRGAVVVLDDVTVDVPATGITAIVGPSGAGKSTLLRLANRLDVPTAGELRYGGGLPDPRRDAPALRRRLGMVFQRPVAFDGSCLDNLRVADPALDAADAGALLARCALDPGLLERDARALSGGEAQRLCIARALAAGPVALLADEPTASLDADARDEVERLARTLADAGMPIVWVGHDAGQIRRLADHVIALAAGRVAWHGPGTAWRPDDDAGGALDAG